ncbi:hypothetical protein O3P69_012735 [Scylla paramamosain]|uniref:Uncharacterized protein n=1 Tax=Scylla paramamosain TaxID=85552 RepID=A0AAW0SF68_SCYPA
MSYSIVSVLLEKSLGCFMQRAEALGKKPEPHSTKELYLSNIPGKQLELVKGAYKDLANPALLQKCFSGRIQNPNESLHSKVWRKVSKDKYTGLHRTRFVSQMTVWEHNLDTLSPICCSALDLWCLASSLRHKREKIRRERGTKHQDKKKTKAGEDTQQETQNRRKRMRLTGTSYQAGAH